MNLISVEYYVLKVIGSWNIVWGSVSLTHYRFQFFNLSVLVNIWIASNTNMSTHDALQNKEVPPL